MDGRWWERVRNIGLRDMRDDTRRYETMKISRKDTRVAVWGLKAAMLDFWGCIIVTLTHTLTSRVGPQFPRLFLSFFNFFPPLMISSCVSRGYHRTVVNQAANGMFV